MDGRTIPNFRRLRALREKLERDIYNRTEMIDSVYTKDTADRWHQTASYLAENERDQELVDEINYVLDFFRPAASAWSARAYFVLVFVSVVVVALALYAVSRTF